MWHNLFDNIVEGHTGNELHTSLKVHQVASAFFIVHMNLSEFHKCDTLFNLITLLVVIQYLTANIIKLINNKHDFFHEDANNSYIKQFDNSELRKFKRNHKNTDANPQHTEGIRNNTRTSYTRTEYNNITINSWSTLFY